MTTDGNDRSDVITELAAREPIFHHPESRTRQKDLERFLAAGPRIRSFGPDLQSAVRSDAQEERHDGGAIQEQGRPSFTAGVLPMTPTLPRACWISLAGSAIGLPLGAEPRPRGKLSITAARWSQPRGDISRNGCTHGLLRGLPESVIRRPVKSINRVVAAVLSGIWALSAVANLVVGFQTERWYRVLLSVFAPWYVLVWAAVVAPARLLTNREAATSWLSLNLRARKSSR